MFLLFHWLSEASTDSDSNRCCGGFQQSAASFPRLPIAPMFDINQVLSAINQTIPPAAAAAASTG